MKLNPVSNVNFKGLQQLYRQLIKVEERNIQIFQEAEKETPQFEDMYIHHLILNMLQFY